MTPAPHLRQVPDPDTGEVITHEACPECAHLRGLIFNSEQDNRRLERDLRAWREKYERLLEDKDAKARSDKFFADAEALFNEWRVECGHPNADFDAARIRLALSAVKRYRKHRDKLSWVIQRAKHFAYVDDRGIKHDAFGLLFRDAEHIERYANEWAKLRGKVAA